MFHELTALETPVPLVDLDRLEANLQRVASYARAHNLSLRPHVKTHKARFVARQQVAIGAVGVTCATPTEAEVMSAVTPDILLAHPLIGPKRERLEHLDPSVRFSLMLDSREAIDEAALLARRLGRRVFVLIEIDAGMRRTGISTPRELIALATHTASCPELGLEGVGFYPGHIRQHVGEQASAVAAINACVEQMLDALSRAGLPARVVSGGSTPTLLQSHAVAGLTEIRPGTYAYNDRTTAAIGACDWNDCALTVLATVISTSGRDQAVVDAGSKALGREPLRAPGKAGADAGYGCLLDRPEIVVSRMSEEHGILDLSRTEWRPRVGDLVRIVPNHVCIVTHLNDFMYGLRGETIEAAWNVEARGRRIFEG